MVGVRFQPQNGEAFVATAPYVVVAPGRGGAQWLSETVNKLGLRTKNNEVDIGVRVEVPNSIMRPLLTMCSIASRSPTRITLRMII